jgi:hypothetical protein
LRVEHSWAVGIACLLVLTACGDAGTGVDAAAALEGRFALAQVEGAPLPIALRKIVSVNPSNGATSSCTEYLTSMRIDVTRSGGATRSESRDLTCDDSIAVVTSLVLQAGTASKTGDGWRLDFTATDGAAATRYFGHLDGANLTIVRREDGTPPLVDIDLTQLVFTRL